MTLNKYNEKRNFNATNEPKGSAEKPKQDVVFVVQKHAASHLHYDFRLEMDGVLKSWAVPKGPSMNPAEKRLAVMVEDHPYTYKDFEGSIEEGNYGAGNVIVWDNGSYTALDGQTKAAKKKNLKAGLLKGHIAIVLDGKKLKGAFDLVKLKGKQENAWLLIKKNDAYATDVDILKKNKSVISNITLEALVKKSTAANAVVKKKPTPKKNIENRVILSFVAPMLAHTVEQAFDKKDWLFEIKYDGYRTIAVITKVEVNLFSRNQLSFNTKFNIILTQLKKLTHEVILDGEMVVEDEKGNADFNLLQQYLKTGRGTLKYYVFDLLNLDGNDITLLPLLQRKELLKILLTNHSLKNIFYAHHMEEKGISFYKSALKNNIEGIMAKDAMAPYRAGKRSSEWLKIKITQQEDAIIIGFTEPKGARNYFGAILLAQYDGAHLKYIGNCGTGFTEATLQELHSKFKNTFTNFSPVEDKIKIIGKPQWLKPKYVAQIKFTEVTADGHLRHPVFVGLREDKNIKDVLLIANHKKENIVSIKKSIVVKKPEETLTKNEYDLKVGKTTLHLTNQHKIYFPDDGITKGEIIHYYKEVADIMLPYLKDRPQSMNRFPNGINGKSFYHKDVDIEKSAPWLKTKKIFSESSNKDVDYLLCNDKATLLYMANLGCIEINPWNSTIKHLEKPDWMVIDLDPADDNFKEVVKTALVVREVLAELETECYCKTSGASGLHIYVPLAAKYDYDSVKIFAELIAHTVNVRMPKTTTIIRNIKKRDHKIYIDFLQNRHGQTLAAPYSVRPQKGATVSTPLMWDEVNEKLSPSQFTIKNMLKRLEKKGDLWKPVVGRGVNLNKVIEQINAFK